MIQIVALILTLFMISLVLRLAKDLEELERLEAENEKWDIVDIWEDGSV